MPPYHQKKSGATTLNVSAELRRACLGRPKACCCVHSNTYRKETGSYHLASFGHHGNPCLRKARCHLLPSSKKLALVDDSRWDSISDLKIGFTDRTSPVRKSVPDRSQLQKHHPAGSHFGVQGLTPKVRAHIRRNRWIRGPRFGVRNLDPKRGPPT